MTKEEFESLQTHDKIKFVGSNPPPNIKVGKSYVVSSAYFSKEWAARDSWSSKEKVIPAHFSLNLWKGCFDDANPADWELVERRFDKVVPNTRSKYGIANAKRTIKKAREKLSMHLNSLRGDLNFYLEKASQLQHKMEFFKGLSPEDKRMMEFLFEYEGIDAMTSLWEKGKGNEQAG